MDLQTSIAAQHYAATRPATAAIETVGDTNFAARTVSDFSQLLQQGEETAVAAMTGNASPHALVQSLAQTELAVEAAVTIRDKVVEAYQEILRMPV